MAMPVLCYNFVTCGKTFLSYLPASGGMVAVAAEVSGAAASSSPKRRKSRRASAGDITKKFCFSSSEDVISLATTIRIRRPSSCHIGEREAAARVRSKSLIDLDDLIGLKIRLPRRTLDHGRGHHVTATPIGGGGSFQTYIQMHCLNKPTMPAGAPSTGPPLSATASTNTTSTSSVTVQV